ncbi:ferrochelatase [Corynebacterium choanae]|uniref:Coproporphyrin III ferrochelatase n=1 Tax=Corynebacterium choanae TaxID=1862358 RepID=A0A3G6J9M8_9CORY|nr:ferrochelatase [Corynebacterium choanae]AZA13598.1 Ferrochelatase [Corynebacterium choanae]
MQNPSQPDLPFDALLVLSFGGPEGHPDVRPFLENVTRGRGIPAHRLDEVEEHYHHFGGKSPLNDLNREMIANIEAELQRRNIALPVYFGNRNWHPLATDTATVMAEQGVRRALVFATSAWAGYSGCRQYHEDIARMREHLAAAGAPEIEMVKIRQFFDHPRFVEATVKEVDLARAKLPVEQQPGARLIFTAHSIPLSMDAASGQPADGSLYSTQIDHACKLVAAASGFDSYDLVWQSRSGPAHVPWLEPDVVDHVESLAKHHDFSAAVVCPIGFLSDHIEVVWDLDSELQQEAEQFGVLIERAPTVGHLPEFAAMVVDLIEEQLTGVGDTSEHGVAVHGCSRNGAPCATNCCVPQRPTGRPPSAQ